MINARRLVSRLLQTALSAFVLLVVARYAYSVVDKFGLLSELARNRQVVAHIVSGSARADVRAFRALWGGSTAAPDRAEVQNENFGEMRVSVSRDELRMLSEAPVASALEEYITTQGTSAREQVKADLQQPGHDVLRRDWTSPAGGDSSLRHSPLAQISSSNVRSLRLIHEVDSLRELGGQWNRNVEAPPLSWNRYVFWLSADEHLIAVDVISGAIKWSVKTPSLGLSSRRGFLIREHENDAGATIFIGIGPFIVAFDAQTGTLDRTFADTGVLKLDGWTVISPLLWNDQLVVALYEQASIVGIDLRTGTTRWSLSLHGPDKRFEGGAPWGGMAIDRAASMLYVTTGNPRPALSGITRPGPNKNTNSIVAIDLRTASVKWTFQEVAHDLWDLDLPAAPILTDLAISGRPHQVVIAVSKMGNTLVLDRESGEPVFDFRRRRAPRSRHVNEDTATYQPDLLIPEPFLEVGWDPSNLTTVSDARRDFVKKQLSTKGTIYGRFQPPELNKDLITFSVHGGAEWHGATVDPESNAIYVPVNVIPWALRVYLQSKAVIGTKVVLDAPPAAPTYSAKCASCHLPSRNGQFETVGEAARQFVPSLHGYTLLSENRQRLAAPEFFARPAHQRLEVTESDLDGIWTEFQALDDELFRNGTASMVYHWRQLLDQEGLPGSAPPWGKIVALSLTNGRKIWEATLGEKVIDGRVVATGSPSYGGLVGTAGGLLFVAGTDDQLLRAVDKRTGMVLWSHRLDAAGSAPPISFDFGGKQYVAVIASGGRFHNFQARASKLYIFSL